MNLYELTAEFASLQAMLENADEQDEAVLEDALQIVAENIAEKADGYARIIKNLSADAAALRDEENRLAKRRRLLESRVDRMKETLLGAMVATGERKIKTSIGTWGIQKNPFSVKVVDALKVPEKFLIPQPPAIDRAAMLAEFKQTGEVFGGVEIVQTEGIRFR